MKTTIFFDWDGTLADSMDLCIEEVSRALAELGYAPRPLETIRECNGPPNEATIGLLGLDPKDGPAYLAIRRRIGPELVPTTQKLFPGIPEMLDRLQGRAELAIVSNGQEKYVPYSAECTGVARCFTRIQTRIVGLTKAEVLARMMREMGTERGIMVGDRRSDTEAGRANGLTTVIATFGYGTEEEWREADYRAGSVEELGDLLLRLLEANI